MSTLLIFRGHIGPHFPLWSAGAMYSDWWESPLGMRKASRSCLSSSARIRAKLAVESTLEKRSTDALQDPLKLDTCRASRTFPGRIITKVASSTYTDRDGPNLLEMKKNEWCVETTQIMSVRRLA